VTHIIVIFCYYYYYDDLGYTSTKPVGINIEVKQMSVAAMALHSVIMMFWKETASCLHEEPLLSLLSFSSFGYNYVHISVLP